MEFSFFLAVTVVMSARDDKFHKVALELCLCGIGSLHCLAFNKKNSHLLNKPIDVSLGQRCPGEVQRFVCNRYICQA
jgi:hypothetical protein